MKGSTTQSLKPETYFKDTDRKVDFMMIQDDDVKQSYCHVLVGLEEISIRKTWVLSQMSFHNIMEQCF